MPLKRSTQQNSTIQYAKESSLQWLTLCEFGVCIYTAVHLPYLRISPFEIAYNSIKFVPLSNTMAGTNRFIFIWNNSSKWKKIHKATYSVSRKQVFQEYGNYDNQELLSKAIESTTPLKTNVILYVTRNKHDLGGLKKRFQGRYIFSSLPKQTQKHFTQKDGLYYYKDRLCVPQGKFRLKLLYDAHAAPQSGYFAATKAKKRLCFKNYWPKMKEDIENTLLRVTYAQKQNPPTIDLMHCYSHLRLLEKYRLILL